MIRLLFWLALEVPKIPYRLDRGVVGVGAGRAEQHVIEPARRLRRDQRGELGRLRRRRLEEGVIIG